MCIDATLLSIYSVLKNSWKTVFLSISINGRNRKKSKCIIDLSSNYYVKSMCDKDIKV